MPSQKLEYRSVVPVRDGLLEGESLFSEDSAVFPQESPESKQHIHLVEVPLGSAQSAHGIAGSGPESIHREIQLSNQQLQATNEQLEVNRDALDAVRELLHRISGEIASRNDLLMQVTSDLTNLLNSVDVPVVMVGSDLRVRRFTSQATTVLGLTPDDVGRSISRLRLRMDLRGLEAAMFDVLRNDKAIHRHLQDEAGRAFSLCVTPCRNMEGRADGLVLTFSGHKGSPAPARKQIRPPSIKKRAVRATVQSGNS